MDRFDGTRWAIVARTVADFGVARMAEVRVENEPLTLRAFRDLAEAEA